MILKEDINCCISNWNDHNLFNNMRILISLIKNNIYNNVKKENNVKES